MTKKEKKSAFTLAEIVLVMGILAVGVLSGVAVSSQTTRVLRFDSNKNIALRLSQEGVENVLYEQKFNFSKTTGCDGVTTCASGRNSTGCATTPACDWLCSCGSTYSAAAWSVFLPGIDQNPALMDIDAARNVIRANYSTDCPNKGVVLGAVGTPPVYLNTGYAAASIYRRIVNININGSDENGDGVASNDATVISYVCWQDTKGTILDSAGNKWAQVQVKTTIAEWQ